MKLVLENVRLRQGSFLLQLDLEVTGRVIGIFGSSGAGKTTLLEIMARLRQPQSGTVRFDDQREVRVGYIPQDLALFPHLSVRANVLYGHKPDLAPSGITLAHVAQVLEIEPLLDRPISALSGGQKQRVAFARALLSSPHLLLLDEPLASLDHDLKWKIIPYLQRIRDEFTLPMVYVSHAPDEVAALCDQVLVLRHGQCLRISPPRDLFQPTSSMTLKPGLYDP